MDNSAVGIRVSKTGTAHLVARGMERTFCGTVHEGWGHAAWPVAETVRICARCGTAALNLVVGMTGATTMEADVHADGRDRATKGNRWTAPHSTVTRSTPGDSALAGRIARIAYEARNGPA